MDSFVRGICKNQDIVFTGTSVLDTESFDYGVIIDGHGTNEFINKLILIDWNEIVSNVEPWKLLYENHLKKIVLRRSSGSTLIIIRAFSNRIETISIGDSRVIIYKNNEYVYGNTPHNLSNPREVERLKLLDTYESSEEDNLRPRIRNSKKVQAVIAYYHNFSNRSIGIFRSDQFIASTKIAMTQSLGHNNITGYDPEFHVEYFQKEDKIDVIAGSDGLFDMLLLEDNILRNPELSDEDWSDIKQDQIDLLSMTSLELVSKAENRWRKKDWEFHFNPNKFEDFQVANFGGSYDDICAVTWRKKSEIYLNEINSSLIESNIVESINDGTCDVDSIVAESNVDDLSDGKSYVVESRDVESLDV